MAELHLTTSSIYGNCSMPPAHSAGDPAHFTGHRMWCKEHCPVCSPPAPPDRTGPVAGMVGQQRGMFE